MKDLMICINDPNGEYEFDTDAKAVRAAFNELMREKGMFEKE